MKHIKESTLVNVVDSVEYEPKGSSQKPFITTSKHHATPDNLSQKLRLDKKTSLADYFRHKDITTPYHVRCNVCDVYRQDEMFECQNCPYYDLCGHCITKGKKCLKKGHEMQKQGKDKLYHAAYACEACGVTPIQGVRYKCKVCTMYDLCRDCKENKTDFADGHAADHGMKEITNPSKMERDLIICPPRRITTSNTFKCQKRIGSHRTIDNSILLRLQEMARQNLDKDLNELFDKIKADKGGMWSILAHRKPSVASLSSFASRTQTHAPKLALVGQILLNKDMDSNIGCNPAFDKIYHATFNVPLKISGRYTASILTSQDTSPRRSMGVLSRSMGNAVDQLFNAEIKVTLLQLAIIASSSRSISTIIRRLDTKNVLRALEEKVEMKFCVNTGRQYRTKDMALHGMNAFHLSAEYCPKEMEMIHQLAKEQIWKEGKSIGADKLKMPDATDKGGGKDVKMDKINKVSDLMEDERFDIYDPEFRLLSRNEYLRKSLIRLQMLLGDQNVRKETPLHIAIKSSSKNQASAVRYLINNYPEAVNTVDFRGFTPLHRAVKLGNEELSMMLLNKNANTGIQGHLLITPLHLAFKPSMVKLLMEHLTNDEDAYKKMHRNVIKEMNGCKSDETYVTSSKILDKDGSWKVKELESCRCKSEPQILKNPDSKSQQYQKVSVLGSLLRRNDAAAIALLDEQIHMDGSHVESKDALLVYDFSIFRQEASNCEKSTRSKNGVCGDLSAHKSMIENKSSAFQHPLSRVFVDLQLQCFRKYLIGGLLRTILFVLALTGMALWQDHLVTEHCIEFHRNCSSVHSDSKSFEIARKHSLISPSNNPQNFSEPYDMSKIIWKFGVSAVIKFYCLYSFVCITLLSIILREAGEAFYNFKEYRRDNGNKLEIVMILTTSIYLVSMFFMDFKIVKHIAAWSLFLAWIEVLLMISRFPRIGVYTIMFMNVAKKLLGYLLLYTPGLIAFALAYHMLLHVEDSPFRNIFSAAFKTLVMMTGEIDYEDNFQVAKTIDSRSSGSVQIILVLFMLFIVIVLANLLVGLAVSEIQKEKMLATSLYNEIAVNEIIRFSNSYQFPLATLFFKCFCTAYHPEDTGTNGVFKSLHAKWEELLGKEFKDDSGPWKLCIDPNITMYSEYGENSNYGILKEIPIFFRDMMGLQDKCEVFFYENIHNEDSKRILKKTGYVVSKDMVMDTITWLKHCKISEKINARVNHEMGINQSIYQGFNQFPTHEIMREIKKEMKQVDPSSFLLPTPALKDDVKPSNVSFQVSQKASNEIRKRNTEDISEVSFCTQSTPANAGTNPEAGMQKLLNMFQEISQEMQDLRPLLSKTLQSAGEIKKLANEEQKM